jgi:Zn-dependent peptidase ImmA (M78 family)/DNA-binding XRE family transcriptional regulator
MINGDRVKEVRELRGLTQSDLAEKIGVNQSTIAQIEKGQIAPSEEVFQRIVFQTGFPVSFFKQPSYTDFPLGSLLFRARASITLRERSEALQYARVIFEIAEKMETHMTKIPLRLPRLDDDPVSAAINTRSLLGLPVNTPIINLISILEKNGILVISLPKELKNRDAFSVWAGSGSFRPIIVICNKGVSGDRLRFNLAHELGHLVIHQAIIGDISKLDKEAHSFAAEFLMPKEAMIEEFIRPVTLPNLISMKTRWKVSIQALIRRAAELEIITIRQYTYLMQLLSARGWRTKEPVDIPVEKPRIVGQMAEILYGIPIDYKKMASHMNVPYSLIKETIESHAIKSPDNNKADTNSENSVILDFKKID